MYSFLASKQIYAILLGSTREAVNHYFKEVGNYGIAHQEKAYSFGILGREVYFCLPKNLVFIFSKVYRNMEKAWILAPFASENLENKTKLA